MMIKIGMVLLMAFLNWARGYHWRPLGIALMSILMGSYFALTLHIWWMLFAVGVPMGICLGLHDQNRGVWCSLVALGASIFLLFFGHLTLYWFVLYCGGNYFLGWFLNNKLKAKQVVIDPITGAGFGVLVFLA